MRVIYERGLSGSKLEKLLMTLYVASPTNVANSLVRRVPVMKVCERRCSRSFRSLPPPKDLWKLLRLPKLPTRRSKKL